MCWTEAHPGLTGRFGDALAGVGQAAGIAKQQPADEGLGTIRAAHEHLASVAREMREALPYSVPSVDRPYSEAVAHLTRAANIGRTLSGITSPADSIAIQQCTAELAAGAALTQAATLAIEAIMLQL